MLDEQMSNERPIEKIDEQTLNEESTMKINEQTLNEESTMKINEQTLNEESAMKINEQTLNEEPAMKIDEQILNKEPVMKIDEQILNEEPTREIEEESTTKEKPKKRKRQIIFLFFLIIGLYIGYKGFYLYYYDFGRQKENYKEIIENITFKDTVTIRNKSLKDDEYLSFSNVKVKNEFPESQKLKQQENEKDYAKYAIEDENGNKKAFFWIDIASYTYTDILTRDSILYGENTSKVRTSGIKKYLKQRNITNDIELFKYLEKHKNDKNHLFTRVSEMRNRYSLKTMISIALPSIKNMTLVDGDYEGYILNSTSDLKIVTILKDGKRYSFTFVGLEYFTDQNIQEILNTIIIE